MQLEMDDSNSALMVEVLWGLFGFLFVMVIFCISLWPMINAQEQQANKEAQRQDASAPPRPVAPPELLTFVVRPTGELFFKGQRVADAEIATIVAKAENPKVEISMASRTLVNLFYQCSQHGLAPTVKLDNSK